VNNQDRHTLLSQAIWLRDNARSLNKGEVFHYITELDVYGELSIRQLSSIASNKISASTLKRYLVQKPRIGGRLNPASLNDFLMCLTDYEKNLVDYRVIKRMMNSGNSQNIIARLTGINQSSISRNTRV
jgi:hypothetical protein